MAFDPIKQLIDSAFEAAARTYDMRQRYLGHDYTFAPLDGGQRAKISGWLTPMPRVGDYLLLKTDAPHGTRYRLTKVSPCQDPVDMFFAEADFAPRTDEDYNVLFVEGHCFEIEEETT